MYTNIQTENLIRILQDEKYNLKHKQAITQFIQQVTRYTTFTFNDRHYLQKKGLPMGGPLSGTLANIYMANYETAIMENYNHLAEPPLLLRYIDDILILTPTTDMALTIINQLSQQTQLEILATPPNKQATFLDLRIIIHNQQITHTVFYKFASPIRRPFLNSIKKEIQVIKSQILRIWRHNNDDTTLTQQIKQIISFLHFQNSPSKIITAIHEFLKLIQTEQKTYKATHTLCQACTRICKTTHTNILKFTQVEQTLIASRMPLHCLTNCTAILCEIKINKQLFLSPTTSIHNTIHNYQGLLHNITPIGNITPAQLNELVKPIQHLLPTQTIQPREEEIRIHVHPVIQHASHTYGIATMERALKRITSIASL
jgi:hypothetical protein